MMRQWMILIEAETRWGYHGTLMKHVPSIARVGLQSHYRPKWSWDDSNRRKFHMLYFSLIGPEGWGVHHDHGAQLAVKKNSLGGGCGSRKS
jgi:hypothetical protein